MNPRAAYQPADERRAGIVEAVLALASATNPNDISTAAIARHLGLTQGALFRHFPSKDAIWGAVMAWVSEHLLAMVEAATGAQASPLATLEAIFMGHVAFVRAHPGVPRMLFGELQRAEGTPAKAIAAALLGRYALQLRSLLEAGKRAGEVAEDLDTEAAALVFIGTIQGLVMSAMIHADVARLDAHAPRAFALFKRGIEAAR